MKTCMSGVMLATLAGMAAAQPVQWRVEDGGNGHWYEFVRTNPGTGWFEARDAALRAGGNLATCTTDEENQFVFSLSLPLSSWISRLGPWLGGFQPAGSPEPNGGWRWVTDEPRTWTHWAPGEPSNWDCEGRTEEYLHFISYSAGWNDLSEDHLQCEMAGWSYVVEWSADCNGDGIVDKGQILSGELVDTNNNGIPDAPGIVVQPTDQSVGVDSPVTFI